jgi:adenosine 3'-phospho 5'-phosphosulfate transporter B2
MAQGDSQGRTGVALRCCFYAGGIIGALWVYGLLQEKIMQQPYDGEKFTSSEFLVFCNRFFAVWFSLGMAMLHKEDWGLKAPLWKYVVVSVSNVLATTCQYEALKYVSFPVQMLGKSFKMMPVMLWGIVISGKRYGLKEWAIALFITVGVTMFLITGPIASPSGENSDDTQSSTKGLLLLLLFLALDGITSPMQQLLFEQYRTSKYNQMFWVNSASAVVSLGMMMTSGTLWSALAFCGEHPALLANALELSAAQVTSQYFIYSQVKEFGAVVFAATMNVRQLFSIMTSYITYHHSITALQVLSLGLVFGALFYKSFSGLMSVEDPPEARSGKTEKTPLLKDAKDAKDAKSLA